jgi:hypothetical protein
MDGTANATGVVGPYDPPQDTPVWLTLSGTWTGTVKVKRSIDGGATKHDLTVGGVSYATFTGNCCEEVHVESNGKGRLYLDITLSSGAVNYTLN